MSLPPIGSATRMRFRPCCFGLAAIVLGSALAPAAAQAPRPIVAVLPLANSSGDAAQDFFAAGLTDEIAVALTGVAGLDVVARSSAFLVKADDLKGIGEKLHARYLV